MDSYQLKYQEGKHEGFSARSYVFNSQGAVLGALRILRINFPVTFDPMPLRLPFGVELAKSITGILSFKCS